MRLLAGQQGNRPRRSARGSLMLLSRAFDNLEKFPGVNRQQAANHSIYLAKKTYHNCPVERMIPKQLLPNFDPKGSKTLVCHS